MNRPTCDECQKAIESPANVIAVLTANMPSDTRIVPVCRTCAHRAGWISRANQHAAIWPNGLGYDVPAGQVTPAIDRYQFAIVLVNDGHGYRIGCSYWPTSDAPESTAAGFGDCPPAALDACQAAALVSR